MTMLIIYLITTRNETLECHAFLCPKRKMAQAATLTIAQAFIINTGNSQSSGQHWVGLIINVMAVTWLYVPCS